jgi:hypothetical protein
MTSACVFVALAALTFHLAPAGAATSAWVRPVAGAVVRAFSAPSSRFGPGHRGVDLAAPAGTPVVAAGEGVVAFAGPVAGSLHVVVAHAGGLRTGYSFLARIDVRVGARVHAGQTIGASGGQGQDHTVGVLHLSLRRGDTYLDPMLLFAPPDLARVVHLAPVRGDTDVGPIVPAREERAIADDVGLTVRLPAWARGGGNGGAGGGVLGALVDATGRVLDAGGDVVGSFVQGGAAGLVAATRFVRDVARAAGISAAAKDVLEVGRRLVDWAGSRLHCTSDAPAADGTGGSGHALMVVAGISSSFDGRGNALGLPVKDLGYDPAEVRSFSYAGTAPAYKPSDTWNDLVIQAHSLAAQLKAMQRADPGREVDLVAHSQGGVVVDVFLKLVYRAKDPTYPPLGTVVSLSSPHRGAPLATAAAEIVGSTSGRGALTFAAQAAGLPPPDGASLRQLAERSPLLRDLWKRPLPDQVDYTSLGAPDDYVVPATQVDLDGAQTVMVDPAGVVSEHDAITHDRRAMSAVRLALEGRPPPCVSFPEGVRDAIEPVVITRTEHVIARAGAAAGRAADALTP